MKEESRELKDGNKALKIANTVLSKMNSSLEAKLEQAEAVCDSMGEEKASETMESGWSEATAKENSKKGTVDGLKKRVETRLYEVVEDRPNKKVFPGMWSSILSFLVSMRLSVYSSNSNLMIRLWLSESRAIYSLVHDKSAERVLKEVLNSSWTIKALGQTS